MDFHRIARSALAGLSHTPATITRSTASSYLSPLQPARRRLLSTTALRLGPPPRSWPPPRPESEASSSPAPAGSSTSSPTATLTNLYPSDKPAQWAAWSSNDFNRRTNQGLGLGGQGQALGGQASQYGQAGPGAARFSEMNSLDFGAGGVGGVGGGQRTRELPFPLKPEAGKTAYVSHRTDVARAFQMCSITLSLNRTKMLWNKQRFHERPGLRRKRLASQTWRRKFRTAMITTVGRVKDLARQGW